MAGFGSQPTTERTKYDHIFDGLQPINGFLSGDKVKPVLLNSNLPVDVLGRVWTLSDIDGDGMLDREEFSVAMHLVYRALDKNPVPVTLPPDMVPPSKRLRAAALPGAVPVLPSAGAVPGLPSSILGASAVPPVMMGGVPGTAVPMPVLPGAAVPGVPAVQTGRMSPNSANWVVSGPEKALYDEMFIRADSDMDGYVNGAEIKDIFLQSGLPQLVLAHIWSLCDTKVIGKLNSEQFALAMYLVQQKLKGIDPPAQLSPDMIPPSMRTFHFTDVGAVAPMVSFDTAGMKELDVLSKDIEDLKQEKLKLEQEKTQKEADIKIRNGEVMSLQKELDALTNTVKQLEAQKAEAQKRLDELDDKKVKLENSLKECKEKYAEEQNLIKELQYQIANRESMATNQEAEMKRMRDELSELRQMEIELEQKAGTSRQKSDQLDKRLTDLQDQIKQVKMNSHKLQETKKSMVHTVDQYNAFLNDEISEEQLESAEKAEKVTSAAAFSGFAIDQVDDPFASKDPFASQTTRVVEDPFSSEDPFAASSDPFANAVSKDPFGGTASKDPFSNDVGKDPFASGADPFGGDPFSDSFKQPSSSLGSTLPAKKTAAAGSDPWGAFSTMSGGGLSGLDNFDPFHVEPARDSKSPANVNDPFGTGSFIPGNSSSPSEPPLLPPKQKKAPAPPRPPAPRATGPGHMDPFDGSDPFEAQAHRSTPTFTSTSQSSASSGSNRFMSEAEQLAWATRDSNQEFLRLKRLQEQEQADLELALALSRQDT